MQEFNLKVYLTEQRRDMLNHIIKWQNGFTKIADSSLWTEEEMMSVLLYCAIDSEYEKVKRYQSNSCDKNCTDCMPGSNPKCQYCIQHDQCVNDFYVDPDDHSGLLIL